MAFTFSPEKKTLDQLNIICDDFLSLLSPEFKEKYTFSKTIDEEENDVSVKLFFPAQNAIVEFESQTLWLYFVKTPPQGFSLEQIEKVVKKLEK